MTRRHAEAVERVAEAILGTPGDADLELRRAVSVVAGGGAAELPADLRPYVEKVARNAYKVTDEDVEALRAAGYSDDAIAAIEQLADDGVTQVCLGGPLGPDPAAAVRLIAKCVIPAFS